MSAGTNLIAEEFIREKIRRKFELKGEMMGLWCYSLNGEDALRWAHEYAKLKVSEREQEQSEQQGNCNLPQVSKSLNYDWVKVNSENDLPTKGDLVLVCRDLIETKQYYTTHWSDEDERYWKLNNIVGWVKVPDFII